jgi:hypothetical protein
MLASDLLARLPRKRADPAHTQRAPSRARARDAVGTNPIPPAASSASSSSKRWKGRSHSAGAPTSASASFVATPPPHAEPHNDLVLASPPVPIGCVPRPKSEDTHRSETPDPLLPQNIRMTYNNNMTIHTDVALGKSGRIVIPAHVREALGLTAGLHLSLIVRVGSGIR